MRKKAKSCTNRSLTSALPIALSLIVGLVTSASARADALEELVLLLADMHGFRANFLQTNLDARGDRLQTNSGEIVVQRPGKLYWHVAPPMEQIVVSDGEQLWLYDPDLEQVTVQQVSRELADTPALLLSGEVELLRASYQVVRLASEEDATYFELFPHNPDSLFESLKLSFRDKTLVQMHIHDALGQRTSLDFSAIELNPKISAQRFEFTPPEGVDVITQ